jgi:hypothetical protein
MKCMSMLYRLAVATRITVLSAPTLREEFAVRTLNRIRILIVPCSNNGASDD